MGTFSSVSTQLSKFCSVVLLTIGLQALSHEEIGNPARFCDSKSVSIDSAFIATLGSKRERRGGEDAAQIKCRLMGIQRILRASLVVKKTATIQVPPAGMMTSARCSSLLTSSFPRLFSVVLSCWRLVRETHLIRHLSRSRLFRCRCSMVRLAVSWQCLGRNSKGRLCPSIP